MPTTFRATAIPALAFASMLLFGCATQPTGRTKEMRAEGERLSALTADPDLVIRMQQRAMRLFPEVTAEMDRLRAEHRVVTAPRLVHAVPPVYPISHRMYGTQGAVWVAFVVSPAGVPSQITAMPVDGPFLDHAFAQAAMLAVSQWRFTPAHVDNTPVPAINCVPIIFQLQ